MSFFDGQGIPEHVLTARGQQRKEHVRAQQDEEKDSISDEMEHFETGLNRLRDYSFVSVEANGHTFAMHRLVQLAIRRWLIQHRQDTKSRISFLEKLNLSFPTGAYGNWTQCELFFPHAKAAE